MIVSFQLCPTSIADILELMKDAPLVNHTLAIHVINRLSQTTTPIANDGLKPVFGFGSSFDEEGVGALPALRAFHSQQSANPQFLVFLCHSLDCNPNATRITIFLSSRSCRARLR